MIKERYFLKSWHHRGQLSLHLEEESQGTFLLSSLCCVWHLWPLRLSDSVRQKDPLIIPPCVRVSVLVCLYCLSAMQWPPVQGVTPPPAGPWEPECRRKQVQLTGLDVFISRCLHLALPGSPLLDWASLESERSNMLILTVQLSAQLSPPVQAFPSSPPFTSICPPDFSK